MQRLRRLLTRRRSRTEESAFVIESSKVLAEALAGGAAVEAVYVETARLTSADRAVVDTAAGSGIPVHELAPGLVQRVGSSSTPQPVLGLASMPATTLDDVVGAGLVLVCAEVQDPGNLGTVIRSAGAAGAEAVVCASGTVDPYNSKCVRASAGALFHIPVIVGDETVKVLEQLSERGFRRLGTAARHGEPVWSCNLTGPVAVVLGNEAHGMPSSVEERLDGVITIPISGRSESLNVGVAASVIAFESARQRAVQAS